MFQIIPQIKLQLNKIRSLNIVPEDLYLHEEYFDTLQLSSLCHIVFAQLVAYNGNKSYRLKSTLEGVLQTVEAGSGFTTYTTNSTTPPASFSSSAEIEVTDKFHRVDILVESQDVEIRFLLSDGTWGNAIPIKVGNASIDFSSTKIQWKYRTSSGGSIHITAWS